MIKLLLILSMTINSKQTYNIEFEKLLNNDFTFFENNVEYNSKEYVEQGAYYVIDFNKTMLFYNLPYNMLSLKKDDNHKIQTITIVCNQIINREIFDLINAHYGKPSSIQVIANRTLESETIGKDENGNIIGNSKKHTLDLKEGSFEENPFLIVWEKKGYQIQALLNQKHDRSSITFSKVD